MTSWTPGNTKANLDISGALAETAEYNALRRKSCQDAKLSDFEESWQKQLVVHILSYIVYLTVRICEDPISSTDYPGTIHDIELHTKYNPYIAEPFYRKCNCLFCRIAMGNCSASKDTCFKEQKPCLAPRANAMLSLAQSPDGLDLQLLVASCGYLISELQRARKIAGIGFNFPFTMFQLFQVVSANTGRCL